MSLIIDTVQAFLPLKRKQTPSGWISFDAVCCHHNGQTADRRKRGGIMITDGVSYHCFNCGFKASWQPGRTLSVKFKSLLKWLNVPDEAISKCVFDALRLKDDPANGQSSDLAIKFTDKVLPLGARPVSAWLEEDPPPGIVPILEYLVSRKFDLKDHQWHWTDQKGFDDRLIIPFYYQGRIVGYTARTIKEGKKPKYISEQQPGYVFNLDNQNFDRKFVLVTEGPLDAISIDGIAVMGNEISNQQKQMIERLKKEIIVVPDRDASGSKIIEQAVEWGWSVSMPEWEPGIKDINDAVKSYGKLYTLWSIVENKEATGLKIQLRMKKWF